MLHLYLVERTDTVDWDEHRALLIAETDPLAVDNYIRAYMQPDPYEEEDAYYEWLMGEFALRGFRRTNYRVRYVGTAAPDVGRGLVIEDFNAG